MKNNLLKCAARLKRFLTCAVALLLSTAAFAADADLDAAFNPNLGLTAATSGTVVQPDGRILIYGGVRFASPLRFSLTRVNADGSNDATFNPGIGAESANGSPINSMVLQPDGKIIIAGDLDRYAGVARNRIARLNADGTLDAAFVPVGPNAEILHVALQADGKILIGGTFTAVGAAIRNRYARLNADGSLDTAFDASVGADNWVRDIQQQPDGKILLGGLFATVNGGNRRGIARLNADGTTDNSFNANFQGAPNLYRIERQPDGKLIIGGFFTPLIGIQRGGIAQLNADGSLDNSFGGGAGVGVFGVFDIELQTDNKVLIGGSFTEYNGTARQKIARLNADGSLDAGFDTSNGVSNNGVTDISIQADGKILISGVFTAYRNVARPGLARLINSITTVNPTLRFADFDGDGKTDIAVFRTGTWFVNASGNASASFGVQFGQAGDVPVPADYDGDGKSDIAVWRGAAFANFFILNSSNNTLRAAQFGTTGDNPTVAGDWDADGRADLAVYRSASTAGGQSFFYYRPSSQTGVDFVPVPWGTSGDTAIFGDFDGDRRLDPAVYRPSNSTYYVRQSTNGAPLVRQWGAAATDAIFAGDFDGDGKSDFAVQRFSGADAGTWYVAQSGGATRAFVWGTGTDVPVPADYDGDGKMDVAVYRRLARTWFILGSSDSQPRSAVFGASGDLPLPLNLVR